MLALALVAGACSVQTAADLGDPPETTETPAFESTPPGESVPSEPAPSELPGEAAQGAVLERFNGPRPVTTLVPPSWNEPLELDSSVVSGELANGVNYLIRDNDRPGAQAQLWLVVQAGSLNEAEGANGTAHFLEHMLFNGTERFPGNELVTVLEGFGSSFGADVNAYTSFGETVYKLQVPTRSSDTLQLGLDVLFQWATAATLDPDAVVAERGVVREEHRRAVEPLSGRVNQEIRSVLFEGTDYLGRLPIGSAEVIDTMTSEQLRDHYEQWYRPELMTVVAVGDFDVGDMERRIAATFVQPPSATPVDPLVVVDGGGFSEPTFDVITDPEIQRSEVVVYWRRSREDAPTQARLRDGFLSDLAVSMLNTRVFELVQGGQSSILSGRVGDGSFTNRTSLMTMSARSDAADMPRALEQLLAEIERARQHGFSQAEMDRATAEIQLFLDQDLAASATQQDNRIAEELVAYALAEDVATAAEDRFRGRTEALQSITADDVQAFLFDVLATNPYVVAQGPADDELVLPIPEELAATYETVVGNVVSERAQVESDLTELMARPEPAAIIDRQRIGGLDTVVVTYANGARLALRPTTITQNEVNFLGVSHGGYFAVEGAAVPLLGRTPGLVSGSGFETVDAVTLDRLLAGSIASLSTSIGRESESVSGSAATANIETLFQLAHLQMTQPTISDLQVRQFQERLRPLSEDPVTRPNLAADLKLWELRYGESPWFRLLPTVEDLDALDPELLLDAYRERFANAGDFVFVMVGDFDVEEVISLGAAYLGTLPDNGVREEPIDRDPGLPEANLVATVQAGVGDQGRVRINWESPYPFTLEAEVTAQVVEIMVNARLRDLIREQLGASYSPSANVLVLSEPKPWVDTIIEIDSDPGRVQEVSETVHAELDRIRAGDIDEQYLTLAIGQLTEDYRFFSNNAWLDLITFHLQNSDRAPDEFRDRTAIVQSLTLDDVVAAASVVFPSTRSVEVWLVPAG